MIPFKEVKGHLKRERSVEYVRMRDGLQVARLKATESPYYSWELRPIKEPGKARCRGKGDRSGVGNQQDDP